MPFSRRRQDPGRASPSQTGGVTSGRTRRVRVRLDSNPARDRDSRPIFGRNHRQVRGLPPAADGRRSSESNARRTSEFRRRFPFDRVPGSVSRAGAALFAGAPRNARPGAADSGRHAAAVAVCPAYLRRWTLTHHLTRSSRVSARELRDRLRRRSKRAGVDSPPNSAERLERYYALLTKWNAKINLTSFRLEPPARMKHRPAADRTAGGRASCPARGDDGDRHRIRRRLASDPADAGVAASASADGGVQDAKGRVPARSAPRTRLGQARSKRRGSRSCSRVRSCTRHSIS